MAFKNSLTIIGIGRYIPGRGLRGVVGFGGHAAGHTTAGQRVAIAIVLNVLNQRDAHLQRMIRGTVVADNAVVAAAVPMIAIRHGLRRSLAATQTGD